MENRKKSYYVNTRNIVRAILSILLIAIILLFFMSKVSSSNRDYIYYEVQENDRIWNIALQFQDGYGDIRDLVHHIMDLNDITGDIFPGDILKIPQ